MISAEQIHDALTLLPEDLLAPVDALRRRRRIRWQPLAALAACACLAVGLYFFFPGAASMDAANGSDGSSELLDRVEVESSALAPLKAVITEVGEDHILVIPDGSTEEVTVTFENLELIPPLEPGQSVRIYCENTADDSGEALCPYRIEIDE